MAFQKAQQFITKAPNTSLKFRTITFTSKNHDKQKLSARQTVKNFPKTPLKKKKKTSLAQGSPSNVVQTAMPWTSFSTPRPWPTPRRADRAHRARGAQRGRCVPGRGRDDEEAREVKSLKLGWKNRVFVKVFGGF